MVRPEGKNYIFTGRYSLIIQIKGDPGTQQNNEGYFLKLCKTEEQLKNQGVLGYINPNLVQRWYLPSEDELHKHLSLQLLENDFTKLEVNQENKNIVGKINF